MTDKGRYRAARAAKKLSESYDDITLYHRLNQEIRKDDMAGPKVNNTKEKFKPLG